MTLAARRSAPVALPAELALAAACALWPHSEQRVAAIHRASRDTIDWQRFIRMAVRHGVVGMAHDGLRRAGAALPGEASDALGRHASAVARRNLAMAAEAIRLHRAFSDAGLPVAFLKGLPLAMLAYGTIALRSMVDIDLLVPEEHVAAADALLAARGYRRKAPPFAIDTRQIAAWMRARKHFVYTHDAARFPVELHWRLHDNPLLQSAVPAVASWTSVPIGAGIALPTLAADDLLLYLSLHGVQHGWACLKWIGDIAALCAAEPARLERLSTQAATQGLGRVAGETHRIVTQVFGAALPVPVPGPFSRRDARVICWLAATALRTMSREGGEIGTGKAPSQTFGVSLSRFLMKPGVRFKLAQLRCAMTSAEDWTVLPLPYRFRGLYVALRLPLLLWRRVIRPERLAR